MIAGSCEYPARPEGQTRAVSEAEIKAAAQAMADLEDVPLNNLHMVAAKAALEAAAALAKTEEPVGSKPPAEPSKAMIEAGTEARWRSAVRDPDNVREIWRAMHRVYRKEAEAARTNPGSAS